MVKYGFKANGEWLVGLDNQGFMHSDNPYMAVMFADLQSADAFSYLFEILVGIKPDLYEMDLKWRISSDLEGGE